MTLSGIDISQYQTTTPALGGLAFVIPRATVGTVKDSRFDQHYNAGRAAHVAVGAYHFNWKEVDPATQARFFLSVAEHADFLALDVEGDHGFSVAQASAFIAEIHKAGRRIGMYHSDSGFPDAGQDWAWVAKWSSTAPTRPWTFWQFNDGPPDHDKFNGDTAAFAAFLAKERGGVTSMSFNLSSGKLTAGPSGARLCHSPDLNDAISSRLPAGATVAKLGGISGWRVGVVELGGVQTAMWIPKTEIASETGNAALDTNILTGTAGDYAAGFAAAKAKAQTAVSNVS